MVSFSKIILAGAAVSAVSAAPFSRRQAAKPFTLANGQAAIALNAQFASLKAGAPCSGAAVQCAGDLLAQCIGGALVASSCAGGTVCRALPLVNSAGTSVTCDTAADADARITNTGATSAAAPAPAAAAPAPAASSPAPAPAAPAAPAPAAGGTAPAGAKPFTLANGQAAIALNAQFATLKAGTPCTSTAVQCAGDALAQCVNGVLSTSSCAGGLVCRALPLVNSAGTSVTCDTAADATARITATGALAKRDRAAWARRAAFTLANGQAARALNAQFATLAAGSACTPGTDACVGGAFAQCGADGTFVTFPCAAGLTCTALPLVNSAGTSITCDTAADAETRIAATGA